MRKIGALYLQIGAAKHWNIWFYTSLEAKWRDMGRCHLLSVIDLWSCSHAITSQLNKWKKIVSFIRAKVCSCQHDFMENDWYGERFHVRYRNQQLSCLIVTKRESNHLCSKYTNCISRLQKNDLLVVWPVIFNGNCLSAKRTNGATTSWALFL